MNCKEFEKLLQEDPANSDEAFITHRKECITCQAKFEDAIRFEEALLSAFKVEPKVDGLSEKLISRLSQQKHKTRVRRIQFGNIAAGFAIFVIVGFMSTQLYQKWSLTDFILSHVDHEYQELDNIAQVNTDHLNQLLNDFDSHYLGAVSKVTYVRKCWMRTGNGLHLIFQGQTGPVTLLLMPNEPIDNTLLVKSSEFQGKVYASEKGSFALVGLPGEPIEILAEKIRMAMLNYFSKAS